MVDGSALLCEGMTDELTLTIGPCNVSNSFYVVRGLEYGILTMNILHGTTKCLNLQHLKQLGGC